MAIIDTSWSSQEKITSAKLDNMSKNELNKTDNIHPQYDLTGVSVASGNFKTLENISLSGATITMDQNITATLPFFHKEPVSPAPSLKYRFLLTYAIGRTAAIAFLVKITDLAGTTTLLTLISSTAAVISGALQNVDSGEKVLSTPSAILKIRLEFDNVIKIFPTPADLASIEWNLIRGETVT